MRNQHNRALLFVCSAILLLSSHRVHALIPEPDVVFHGQAFFVNGAPLTAADTGFTILLKVNGTVTSSYTMGEIPAAQDQYVLKVTLDAKVLEDPLDPPVPGTARFGDSATIFVVSNNGETELATVNIGKRGTITSLAILNVPNSDVVAPSANAGGPYSGTAGTPLSFNGSGSTDPDGTIVSYAWDFGDGGSGSGVTPSHTYAAGGLYTVSLTVTDNDGASSAPVTTTATIDPGSDVTPPVITLLGANPVNIKVGSTYTDAGATASDNIDGDISASIVTVSTVNPDLAGIYSVTYNVSDAAGNPAVEVSRTVNVTDDIIFGDGFEGNP